MIQNQNIYSCLLIINNKKLFTYGYLVSTYIGLFCNFINYEGILLIKTLYMYYF